MFLSYIEDFDKDQISIRHLEKAIEPVVPLAQTMNEKISKLREWAFSRARLASSVQNNEVLMIEDEEQQIPKTRREVEEDIF